MALTPYIKISDAAKSTKNSCSEKSFAWAAATEKRGKAKNENKKKNSAKLDKTKVVEHEILYKFPPVAPLDNFSNAIQKTFDIFFEKWVWC